MRILKKLASRKLWLAVAGLIAGLAMSLGVDAGDMGVVSGAVTAVASVIAYITVEGRIDAEGVKTAVEKLQEAAGVLGEE